MYYEVTLVDRTMDLCVESCYLGSQNLLTEVVGSAT